MESMGGTFKNGANFAVVGSSTLPKYVPFSLNIQLMQFLRFKSRSLQLLLTHGSGNWINEQGFRNALYMIDIGQNDIADSFSKNMSYTQVVRKIPSVLIEIKDAFKVIYDQGGRKFWVHNTGPLGCLPQKLTMVRTTPQDKDNMGCILSYNAAARVFNQELNLLCQRMRSELKGVSIVYIDIYSIKYDMITNSNKYGFTNPLMACCGSGGAPYNYNINTPCGQTGSQACSDGAKSISWDGIHYTEAANHFVASKILSMQYSTPRTPFNFFCRG